MTLEVDIAEEHHRSLIPHARDLQNKYNVRIKFPARGTSNEGAENGVNGGILPSNLVQITGRDTKCEEAKQALIALIPITETVSAHKLWIALDS